MIQRIVWADAVKGWLILLVIMGHCIASTIGNEEANVNYWWCLIYSFHMPAFIAISGFFSYKSSAAKPVNIGKTIVRRFQQLMVPFMLWSVIKIGIEGGDLPNLGKAILYPTNTFWFLWALFFIVVLFALFDWISQMVKVSQEVVMVILCLMCAGTMAILKDIRIFGIQYVLYYFIFYCLGYYINKYHLIAENKWMIALMVFGWFGLASFWRPRELPLFVPLTGGLATMVRFAYKFVVALAALFAIFSFAPKAMNNQVWLNRVICKLGVSSLGIYTFHLTFTDMFVKLLQLYVDNDAIVVLTSFVLLTVASYIVVVLLGKWKWTARLLLGKV